MTDIARLGIGVDSEQVKSGTVALDAMVQAADRASRASVALARADYDRAKAALAALQATDGAAKADINAAEAAVRKANAARAAAVADLSQANAVNIAAAGNRANANAVAQVAAGNMRLTSTAEASAGALTKQGDAAQIAAGKLARLGQSANDNINRLQASPSNIAAQFQDIGVTAAAGMNPLLIALQQGTQLSAAMAGGGLKNLGAAFSEVFSITALGTIAVVALVAWLIELAIKFFSAGDGAEDAAKAFAKVKWASDGLAESQSILGKMFDLSTGKLKNNSSMLRENTLAQLQNNRAKAQQDAIDNRKTIDTMNDKRWYVGNSFGPGIDIGRAKDRSLSDIYEKYQVQKYSTDENIKKDAGINALRKLEAGRVSGKISLEDFIKYNNAIGREGEDRFNEKISTDAIDSFNSGKLNPEFRHKGAKGPRGGRSEGEKFSDLARKAENDILMENVKAKEAAGEATSAMEYKTKLLSDATQSHLKLTDAQVGEIDRLAAAYGKAHDALSMADIFRGAKKDIAVEQTKALNVGIEKTAQQTAFAEEKTKLLNDAHAKGVEITKEYAMGIDLMSAAYAKQKVAADDAVAMRDVMTTSKKDLEQLRTEISLIGMKGRELDKELYLRKLIAEAKSKNATPQAILAQLPTFIGAADEHANLSVTKDTTTFGRSLTDQKEREQAALSRQRGELTLGARATAIYRYETEALAKALVAFPKGIPVEIADQIHQQSQEMGAQAYDIQRLTDLMDTKKAAVKGFFTEFYSGINAGKSVWDSFGDAAVNAINKIINKLLDNTLNDLIDNLFSKKSGGGGVGGLLSTIGGFLGFANGGAFGSGGVQQFANGGMFTNSVVSQPTLFKFANGGALGVMGEAGPEAIMPLKRGSNGSLGVQMFNQQSAKSSPTKIEVNVTNNHTVSGAVSSQDIVELNKRSAQQTKDDLRRSIPGIIEQYQRDGALV